MIQFVNSWLYRYDFECQDGFKKQIYFDADKIHNKSDFEKMELWAKKKAIFLSTLHGFVNYKRDESSTWKTFNPTIKKVSK